MAALALAAGVPVVDSADFFTELAATAPRSMYPDGFVHVPSTFPDALQALIFSLGGFATADPETYYSYDIATSTVTATQYAPDDVPAELEALPDGEIADTNYGVFATETTCRAFEALRVAPVGRSRRGEEGHMLYAILRRDNLVTINDPNESSLQEAEEYLRPTSGLPTSMIDSTSPGGWCQTWSWFAIECALMGVSGLHDALAKYFNHQDVGLWQIVHDANAPAVVAEVTAAMSAVPDSSIAVGAVVTTADGQLARVVRLLKPSVYEIQIGTEFSTADADSLTVTDRPAGFGLALTALVLRLAARYEKLCTFDYTLASLKAAIAAARARRVRPITTPLPPDPATISEPMTAILKHRRERA